MGEVELQSVTFASLPLDSGGCLEPVTIAYETYGTPERGADQRGPDPARALGGRPRRRATTRGMTSRAGGRP